MMQSVLRFARDTRGATAIEYGLISALIVVAIIGALTLLFNRIGQNLNYVGNALASS